ncbi:MAG: sigma-70 family RNA polymerase sigma factor [Bacteroidales bacterium]|nr:sigma-70 family RNA polymerase sigma factor [Bacteroidales bacterium]
MEVNEQLIKACAKGKIKAQKELYDMFSPVFYVICLRYAYSKAEAEDVLQEGFVKIFKHIAQYEHTGSFIAWMKRIVVNTAITFYHKNKRHNTNYDYDLVVERHDDVYEYNVADFTMEELLEVIQELSPGYKMVFNLYAIEGYKHREIAEILGIDINTSKSQYSRAKKILQAKLIKIKDKDSKNIYEKR